MPKTSGRNDQVRSESKLPRVRVSWKQGDSISVIGIVNEFKLLNRLDDKSTKKNKIFEKICEELGLLDPPIVRTPDQVKNHWKFLQSEFQKFKRIAATSGEGAVHWPMYEEMLKLIGDRPKAKFVETGVDSKIVLPELGNEDSEGQILDLDTLTGDTSSSVTVGSILDSCDLLNDAGSSSGIADRADSRSDDESLSGTAKKRPTPLLQSLKPAAVKKSRSEKTMEIMVSKHQETADLQQDKLLKALKAQREEDKADRERDLEHQRAWESQEAEKQRKWEREMIEWRTSQTNAMLMQLSNAFTQSVMQAGLALNQQREVILDDTNAVTSNTNHADN